MDANRTSRKAVFLVVLVFILGLALGGVGTYVINAQVEASRAKRPPLIERLTKDLGLTPEQVPQVDTILTQWQKRDNEIRQTFAAQSQPQYDQVRHDGREAIRKLLTPEQLAKFNDLTRRVDEERAKRQQQAASGGTSNRQ